MQSEEGTPQEVIQRLLEAEREARKRGREGKEKGEEVVESARQEAGRQVKKAEEAARREAEKIIREAEEQVGKATVKTTAGIGNVETLRRHGEENMSMAVNFLVDMIINRKKQ